MGVLQLRPAHSLPHTQLPWLELRDHFIATVGPSAGQGQALGPLRVLADATFAPHSRFPLHGHRDMEILSIVVDGELSHHGDQAQGALLGPRSAQLISARDGIVHAEGNDTDRTTRMLQIWFTPGEQGGAPAYFDRQLPAERGQHLVAGDALLPLRCDAQVWWLDVEGTRTLQVGAGRRGYLVVLAGPLRVAASTLATGDGAELSAGEVVLEAEAGAALWIDLAE